MTLASFKRQLHFSAIQILLSCAHCYYLRYVKALHRPRSHYLAVGSAAHEGANANLTNVAAAGSALPLPQVEEVTAACWRRNCDSAEGVSEDGRKLITKKRRGELQDETLDFARIHYTQLAPSLRPTMRERIIGGQPRQVATVEWPFVLEMRNWPYNLAGTIDLLEFDDFKLGQPHLRVRDAKTTRSTPRAGQAAAALQLTDYAMGAHYELGQAYPLPVAYDYLVAGARGGRVVTQWGERTAEHERVFLRYLERVCRSLETGVFLPADSSGFMSPCPRCAYRWGDCRFCLDPEMVGTERKKKA